MVIKNCTYQVDIECGKKCYGKDRYMYQFYLKWPWGEGEGGGEGVKRCLELLFQPKMVG